VSTVMRSTFGGEAGALAVYGSGVRLQAADMASDIVRAKASVFGDISQQAIRPALSGHGVSRSAGGERAARPDLLPVNPLPSFATGPRFADAVVLSFSLDTRGDFNAMVLGLRAARGRRLR